MQSTRTATEPYLRKGTEPKAARALVVDYAPQVLQLITTVLRRMTGVARIDATLRGDTAAGLLERNDYDVVILDALIPHGEESLLGHLARSRPSICGRTIVITAAPVDAHVRREIEAAAPYACLDKPFDIAELAGAVQRCTVGTWVPALARTGAG
jgi:DNA-binding NarL/FixJ family response regulator